MSYLVSEYNQGVNSPDHFLNAFILITRAWSCPRPTRYNHAYTYLFRFLKIIFEQFTYTWLRYPVSPTLKGSYNANKASKLHLIPENF